MSRDLNYVYEGWKGFNQSIVNAVAGLTPEQLAFRATPDMRSVEEVAWHIADGRVDWFRRIDAPGSAELTESIAAREGKIPANYSADELVTWLNRTYRMVEETLAQWTVDDLAVSFHHPYAGKIYAVSRQWVIWRIMAHDIYHGGQLSEILAIEGIEPTELTWLGGHLTEPPVVG